MADRTFRRFDIAAFEAYIASVPVTRAITNIQIHHTAAPTLNGYNLAQNKAAVIKAMWTYHTKTRGFRDIAQHFSIAPDGVWDGRDLDWDSGGFLGGENVGGICVEIIGFFDRGKEAFTGSTAENAYRAVAAMLKRWPRAEVRFHRDQPSAQKIGKTCPGTAITMDSFLTGVGKYQYAPNVADELYALGVPISITGWHERVASNPALRDVLQLIVDNWADLDKIPWCGALFSKIGEKLGN